MSFAIIETGGKQYKVSASKILEIEKLNAKVGETIRFDNVLLVNDDKSTEVGNPKVEGPMHQQIANKLAERNKKKPRFGLQTITYKPLSSMKKGISFFGPNAWI